MNNHFLQGKTILLVNTGSIKKRFILQKLKKLGMTVVAVNKEKNWAQPYVDHWILADTYNHNDTIQNIKDFLANTNLVKLDGAVTFWEDDIPLLAKICDEFKLIGNNLEAAINTRDKFRMQEVFQRCGLPFIKQKLLKGETDLESAILDIGFPAVMKPVFGADSEFVVAVKDREEAYEAYKYLIKNCTADFDPIFKYNKRMFLYQEFIDGHEFSMESYSQHGVPHIVGIHEKTAMTLPFFLETGDYIPPRIDRVQEEQLTKITEAALITLGVVNSLAHVEVKLTDHGPRVIEVASRMGGDYTSENIGEIYGFDLIKTACEIATGINIENTAREPKKYIVSKFFIPKNSGVVTRISGLDELKGKRGVVDFFLGKKVGDSVLVPPDGYENVGWLTVSGDSYAEAESLMNTLTDEVKIEVAPFRSYSSFGKTTRKDPFSSALITKKTFLRSTKIESLRRTKQGDLKNLHIGIACNIYEDTDANDVERDLMSVGKNIEKALLDRGYRVSFFDFNDVSKAFVSLKESDVDLVFNVCERINNSSLLEPHAASILDVLQIPYTGSNPMTLALCIDKIRVKKLLAYHNIPTPKWDYAYTLEDEIDDDLEYPLIVKPANTDNSIGITNESVVRNKKELEAQLVKVVKEIGSPALVEEYIEGDEYDVSILGSDEDDYQVMPLSRSIFKDMPKGYWHIYPYAAKWSEDPAYKTITTQRPPKNVNQRVQSLITEIALDTYRILDCHDYGRVEIRVDNDNNPYVLELNPNPSINIEDCIPACAELIGMNYADFIEEIIRMAIRRYKNKPPYYHLQTSLI